MPKATPYVLAAALLLPAAAAAAGPPKVEITPFVGYRLEGDFDVGGFDDFFNPFDDLTTEAGDSLGLVASFAISGGFMIELIVSHQESALELAGFLFEDDIPLFDLDIDHYHAGFIYRWTPGQVHPFIGASVGFTRLDPRGIAEGSLDRPSISIGGGVKLFVTDHLGFRFEGRGFWTFIEDDVGDICDFDCGFHAGDDSVYLVQPEFRAGVIFAF